MSSIIIGRYVVHVCGSVCMCMYVHMLVNFFFWLMEWQTSGRGSYRKRDSTMKEHGGVFRKLLKFSLPGSSSSMHVSKEMTIRLEKIRMRKWRF